MSTWAILQARMSSSRLPGKVLRVVGGRTVLEWVVRAVSATEGVHGVCVAAPEGNAHEPVVQEAQRLRVEIARGSEQDVLGRFVTAARQIDASIVMRVTTDCPLSDPCINAQVLELLSENGVDYACNNEPFSFPHGLDCEVFTRDVLERANLMAKDSYDREHVTPWIKREPGLTRRYLIGAGNPPAVWRWTVDYPEDLIFFERLVENLGDNVWNSTLVSKYLESHPELHEINQMHRQR